MGGGKRIAFLSILVLSLTMALSACSHGPVAGVTPGGSLQVVVSGLPGGTQANVLVTGPKGYSRTVTATTTLTGLRTGSYDVIPIDVTSGSLGFQNSGSRTVQVSSLSGATVKVGYSQLAVKLYPGTVVLDAATVKALASVTAGASGDSTLTFSQSTPQIASLEVGDILMVGVSAATPDGFMGKVTTVSGLIVTTAPAKLTNAIEQGIIAGRATVSSATVASVASLQPAVTVARVAPPAGGPTTQGLKPFCSDINGTFTVQDPNYGTVGASLGASGTVCLGATVDIDATLGASGVKSADVLLSGSGSTSLAITGEVSGGFDEQTPLATLKEPIIANEDPPLEITPSITVYIEPSGKVIAGVTSGVQGSASFSTGATYNGTSWSPKTSFSSSWSYTWPKPESDVQLKLSAGPMVSLAVDGSGSHSAVQADLGIDGYLEYDVNFLQSPLWTLHAGIESTADISAFMGAASYSATLYRKDYVLATSDSTPYQGAYIWSAPTGAASEGGVPALSPDGSTLYLAPQDGTLYAMAAGKNDTSASRVDWTYAIPQSGPDSAPVVSSDGSTIYLGTGSGVDAVSSSGSLLWSALAGRAIAGPPALTSDGTVIVPASGGLYALSPANGATLWSCPIGIVSSSPAIGSQGTITIGGFDGNVYALKADGGLLWKTPSPLGLAVTTSPAIGPKGTIFVVAAQDGGGQVLYALDPANGKTYWKLQINSSPEDTSPVVGPDGTVYVGSVDAHLYAIAPKGSLRWAENLKPQGATGPVGGIVEAAAVGADGNIYLTQRDTNHLIVLNAQGEPVAGLTAYSSRGYGLPVSGALGASPALGANGIVYVSSGNSASSGSNAVVQAIYLVAQGLASSSWPKLYHDAQNSGRVP